MGHASSWRRGVRKALHGATCGTCLALAIAVGPVEAQNAAPPAAPIVAPAPAGVPAAPTGVPAAPTGVPAANVTPAAGDSVTLNFVNADIDAVVKAVADITGRNFIVDPRVKGTVNIVSARPVPRSLVYPTLLSALRMQGIAAVDNGTVVKIVPEADAKLQGGPVVQGAGSGGDRLVTQVIVLRNESAAQLVPVLRPLIAPNNTIAAYPASNALVITDYADNLTRLTRIIASLDQPAGEPVLVPVRNASALDLANLVTRFLGEAPSTPGAPPDPQQRVQLMADPRSNSILVRSDNPARAARARQLIEQLDTPQRAGSNVFIVYLRNADAGKVAETLRGLYGGGGNDRSSAGAFPAPATATLTASGPTNVATTTTMTALGASPQATAPLASGSLGAGAPAAFQAGGATIQADLANNALVILAPEAIYNNLRAVIDKLDLRRAQVFIEALIVEVTSDKAAEFGIQWQVLTGAGVTRNGVQGIGGTNFTPRGSGSNIIDASVSLGSLGQGLNIGLINGSITIPGLGVISNLASWCARSTPTTARTSCRRPRC